MFSKSIMRKRLPTRKCLGEPHSFEDFSFCIPQTSGERGSFPIPLSVCVLFQLLRRKQGLGVGMTAMGGFCPPWVLGWHLMLGRCGIWLGKRGEQSGFFFSHHRGNPRWRPFMSKDPSPTSASFAQISLL